MSSPERQLIVYRRDRSITPSPPPYEHLGPRPPLYEQAIPTNPFQNVFTFQSSPAVTGAGIIPPGYRPAQPGTVPPGYYPAQPQFQQSPQHSQEFQQSQTWNSHGYQQPPNFIPQTSLPQHQGFASTSVAPTTLPTITMAQPYYVPAYTVQSTTYPYGTHPAAAMGTHPQAIILPHPSAVQYVQYPPVYYPGYVYPAYQPYFPYPYYYVKMT
jgi:hypothetical protein